MIKAIGWLGVTACVVELTAQPPGLTPMERSLPQAGFERIEREDGVTVYKHPETEVIHLAAEGRFAASPAEVQQVLLAYEDQVGQVERVASSRVLERGDGWLRVYQRLELPIVSDRDYTLCVNWGAEGDSRWIRYRIERGTGPPADDDAVRVPAHRGSWQLQPRRDGAATLARYESIMDMGGWIPRWLAKSTAGDEVPGVFADFRAMLRDRKKIAQEERP